MQILVVEDDQALAEGLCTALRRQNYAVNSVSSGRDALHVHRLISALEGAAREKRHVTLST